LEQGATLPAKMGDFPPEMFGLPIEDVDEYYFNKYVSIDTHTHTHTNIHTFDLLFNIVVL